MSDATAWLPEKLHWDGDLASWQPFLERTYQRFLRDFVRSKPQVENKRWAMKRFPLRDGKEATFYHLTTSGPVEEDRLPEPERCRRMPWNRALIDDMGSENVCVWEVKRGRNKRINMAPTDFSHLVVLEDRGDHIMIWTAYGVEHRNQRKKYENEWKRYVSEQQG